MSLKALEVAGEEVSHTHKLLLPFLESGSEIHQIQSLFGGGLNTPPVSVTNWLISLGYEVSHFHRTPGRINSLNLIRII